ncbi:DUF3558 domain-containing protein [Saccharopolyspora gregorii]|uniref:DUF3558 domain-containing protein n=1 Tax=Saccharopolyspora gregorii TaxID=33914 RepID=UPI0021AC1125|nr:DUF3558 domain-containing protein [Saccharopolyspora gregorii]
MTKRAIKRAVQVVVLASLLPVLIGGCALNGSQPTGPQQGQAAPPPEPGLDLPERPRDLPVAGLGEAQICELIKPEQLGQLGVGGGNPAPKDAEHDFPGCSWLSEPGAASSIGVLVLIAPMSVQDLQAQSMDPSGDTATTYELADGFGAVQTQVPGAERLGCVVDVDVAEGKTLEAGLSWQGGAEMTNQAMCAKAKQAAEFAVSNLQAQA